MVLRDLSAYIRHCRRRVPIRSRGVFSGAVLAAVLLVGFLFWANSRLRPELEALAVAQACSAVTTAVNDAIVSGIAEEDISYDDMVTIETDEHGRVTVLKSNMAQANLFRAHLLAAALEEVSELTTRTFSIPMGNLTQNDFLSGKGPGIKTKILSAGSADAVFRNSFTAAGVNQTLHQIILDVHVTVSILLPGGTVEAQVSIPVCVAETVIVGQVPDTYLQLERGS